MGFSGRWLIGVGVLAAACLLAAACGGNDEQAPAAGTTTVGATQGAGASPTAAAPSPTAAQGTATPSTSQLATNASYYLDASAVLPGFRKLDPAAEGLSNEYLGLGADYSEVTAFLSEQPFETVFMFMHVASGEVEKAAAQAELRDEQHLEDAFLGGFTQGAEGEDVQTTIDWSDADVGDQAKLAHLTATASGGQVEVEMLIFLQDRGSDTAVVFVGSMWLPGEPPTVDAQTIGREISSRIASP